MPHTNRKKKPLPTPLSPKNKKATTHTKRLEVLDSSGWTHVLCTPRNSKPSLPILPAGNFQQNGAHYITLTLTEMLSELSHWRRAWERDSACQALKEGFGVRKGKGKGNRRPFRNVVVLGLGSLQSARGEGRRVSWTQLAALETMLEASNVASGDVVFQDPLFTDMDRRLLGELGYEVLADPEAFARVGEGSLVYAVHCYADVYRKVAEGKRAAVFVGTDVRNFGRFDLSETAEETKRVLERMVEGCEVVDFPQVRYDFSDTKIYWRKEVEDEP